MGRRRRLRVLTQGKARAQRLARAAVAFERWRGRQVRQGQMADDTQIAALREDTSRDEPVRQVIVSPEHSWAQPRSTAET